MRNLYLLAAVLACFGALFAITFVDMGDLELTNPMIAPLAHTSLTDYSGLFMDPGLLLESPYELTPLAVRAVPESSADIDSGKIIYANKDSIMLAHKVSGSNMTTVYLYTLNGSSIALSGAKSMEWSSRNTHVYSISNIPSQYKFLIGGHYDYTTSVSYPLLAFFTYSSGALSTPSYWSISPVSDSYVVDTDAGDVNADGATDYVLLLRQDNASNDFIRLTVRRASASSTVVVGQKYASGNWPTVKVGKYTTASTKDMMVAASDGTQADLLHYRLAANGTLGLLSIRHGLTTSAGKKVVVNSLGASDLDNDGEDELLVSGYYAIGIFNTVDVTQVYKYGPYGWEKKNEYVNATPGSSVAQFAGTADVNSDGVKEIVSVSKGVYTNSEGDASVKIRVNIFKYNSGSSALQRLSSNDIKPAGAEQGYWPSSAALGDYNADGKQELAINFWDMEAGSDKLGIYSIGQDLIPPNITIYSPYYSLYSNTGSLLLRFYAYDSGGLNASSFRGKLTGPGGYDSGYRPYFLNYTYGTNNIIYNSSVNIAGLPAGNYTVAFEVADKAGNKKTATKKISIYSTTAPVTYPNLTIYSPASSSWFYNNSTIAVKFQAYDADGINVSSMKAKLMNANYTSGMISGVITWPPGSKARNYTENISLVGRKPGTYYLYMYAYDALGYGTYKYIYIYVYATPAAPAPEPEVPADTPVEAETPIEPETPAPEPEVAPEVAPEPETPPVPETPAEVEAPPATPPSGTEPETPPYEPDQPETPPTPPPQTQPGEQPSQPGTVGGDTGAQSQADDLITELEVKIAVAKGQGVETSPMAERLDKAKSLAQEGKYIDAALEAQKGVNQVEQALALVTPTQPPFDYMPYLIGGAVLVGIALIALFGLGALGIGGLGLGGAYLLFGRKPPTPPASAAPSKPGTAAQEPEPEEEEPGEAEAPAKKSAKKAKKGKR